MKAVTESTLAAPAPRRDVLAGLLLEGLKNPNQGIESQARACASIAMAFAWLDQADDRLAAKHQAMREQSLVKALARALQLVEMTDLDEAIRITGQLEADVLPLVGGPLILNCSDALEVLVEPLPEPEGCIFNTGSGCVHRVGGDRPADVNDADLLESLTDFFARQHHEVSIARCRAESVLVIVRAHADGGAA